MEKQKFPQSKNNLSALQNKIKIYKNNYNNKVKLDPVKLENHRQKNLARVKKFNEKKNKLEEQSIVDRRHAKHPAVISDKNSPYASKSSETKALKKAMESLPKNKTRAQHIIKLLNQKYQIPETTASTALIKRKYQRKGYENLDELAKKFYESDVVSKHCPGIRDFVIMRDENGKKIKIQKFLMHITVERAHEEFKLAFPSQKVCLSKFSSLRPKYVQTMDKFLWNTCVCIYCANLSLICEALARFFNESKLSPLDLLKNLCCDENDFNCASNNCENCQNFTNNLKTLLEPDCFDKNLKYEKWKHGGEFNFVQKQTMPDKTVNDVLIDFEKEFKYYKLHMYIERAQKKFLKEILENLDDDCAVLQADYSEKFKTVCQHAVQAFYFGTQMLSIFTVRVYVGKNFNYSFALVSNNTHQTKREVFACLKSVIARLKLSHPSLRHVTMFTDGSGSQFKNKFSFNNILFAKNDHDVITELHFSPTGHGKSPCDAIGGIVKRGVHSRVMTNKFKVFSASDFVECAKDFCKNIICYEMTDDDFAKHDSELNSRWNKNVKPVVGTLQYHSFKLSEKPGCIIAAKTSRGDDAKVFKLL